MHLADAIRAGCAWYDLEIETVRQCPSELIDVLLGEGRQLASAHFFERMPKNLPRVAAELRRGRPEAIKIAAQCDSLADSRKLLDFARKQRNIVAIPMGDVALPARILALRERNSFAYAPVENATAPGQVSLSEIKDVYRADRLGPAHERLRRNRQSRWPFAFAGDAERRFCRAAGRTRSTCRFWCAI